MADLLFHSSLHIYRLCPSTPAFSWVEGQNLKMLLIIIPDRLESNKLANYFVIAKGFTLIQYFL